MLSTFRPPSSITDFCQCPASWEHFLLLTALFLHLLLVKASASSRFFRLVALFGTEPQTSLACAASSHSPPSHARRESLIVTVCKPRHHKTCAEIPLHLVISICKWTNQLLGPHDHCSFSEPLSLHKLSGSVLASQAIIHRYGVSLVPMITASSNASFGRRPSF